MLTKVMFVGRYSAETCGPWPDFALISLGEPDAAEGDPQIQDGWHDVLRLSFHDITPDTLDVDGSYTLMADADAQKIVAFVKEVAPNVECIIVHCRAGISRSAAVAKWICSEYDVPFNGGYDRFNAYVYRLMVLAAAGSSDAEASEEHLAQLRAGVNLSVFVAEPLKARMITDPRKGDTQADVAERQSYLDIITGHHKKL